MKVGIHIFIPILLVLVMLSCKPEELGFGQQETIIGKVFRLDSISSNNIVVENADVYVGFGNIPTTQSYNFKTTTDKDGNFSINYLRSGSYNLLIVYKVNENGFDIIYKDEQLVKTSGSINEFHLKRDVSISRITGQVVSISSVTKQPAPQPGATVYVGYKTVPTTTSFIYKLTTDENGIFSSPYINLTDSMNFNLFITYQPASGPAFSDTLTYSEFLSVNKIVLLSKNAQYGNVKGTVYLNDLNVHSNLVPCMNVDVYLGRGFAPTTVNSSYTVQTSSDGSFSFNNIYLKDSASFNYLFVYNYLVNGAPVRFEKRLSHNFAALQNVVLQPRDMPGIVTLKIVDDHNNTPQPNIDVCIFSNRTFFEKSESCTGSMATGKTNNYGNVFFTDLFAGSMYYVRGFYIIEKDTMEVRDSIIISGSYPQQHSSFLKPKPKKQ